MALTDRIEPTPAYAGIITRSDRVPTEYERYGDWARKFFGYGCHRTFKDAASAPSRTVRVATGAPTQQH